MFKIISLKDKKIRLILLLGIVFLLTFLLCLKLEVPQRAVKVIHRQERLLPIYFVETPEKKIAFSFDASWGAEKTPLILSILHENDLKSSFFLTGFWVEKYPDMIKEIDAAGHEVGNHTYSHPHLNNLGEKEIAREVETVHTMIETLIGKEPNLFRAPFGEYNNKVIRTLDSMGYKTIQWSIDSLDWKELSQAEIVSRVTEQLHNGAIILFHNNGLHTAAALPEIIKRTLEEGYRILPISELLHQEEYYIDNNSGAQIRGRGER